MLPDCCADSSAGGFTAGKDMMVPELTLGVDTSPIEISDP